jgi:cytochrome c-type biogenesis protein
MSLSLGAIFSAGLLTFASPCVLPLIPVYLATIAGGAVGMTRAGTVARALCFTLGLSSVFVALGALAATLGELVAEYRPFVVGASSALMILFGLRALGLLRVEALDRDARPALGRVRNVSTLAGAFLFGAAFGLGWSPCIGPVLASVLTFAATSADSPLHGAAYLAVYAAGLSAPLLLLGALTDRATAWLKACRPLVPRLERATGLALLVVGVWTGWSAVSDALAAPPPVAAAVHRAAEPSLCAAGDAGHAVCGLPELDASGQHAALETKDGAHLLEFTSGDCPVCQRMRPVVDGVEAGCADVHDRFVQVDVTTREGRALAARHGVRGTPTLVFVGESGQEQTRLIGEQTQEELHAALQAAWGVSCEQAGTTG